MMFSVEACESGGLWADLEVTHIGRQGEPVLWLREPPHCPRCTGMRQPGTVWPGESADAPWIPLTSSPCHPGSDLPLLLPGIPRHRSLSPICPQITPQTPFHKVKEVGLFLVIHPTIDLIHPSIHQSTCQSPTHTFV